MVVLTWHPMVQQELQWVHSCRWRNWWSSSPTCSSTMNPWRPWGRRRLAFRRSWILTPSCGSTGTVAALILEVTGGFKNEWWVDHQTRKTILLCLYFCDHGHFSSSFHPRYHRDPCKRGVDLKLPPRWMVLALGTAAMYLPHQHPKFLDLIKQPFVKVMQMIAGIIDGTSSKDTCYVQKHAPCLEK